jgi:hypothetical protein
VTASSVFGRFTYLICPYVSGSTQYFCISIFDGEQCANFVATQHNNFFEKKIVLHEGDVICSVDSVLVVLTVSDPAFYVRVFAIFTFDAL